MKTKTARLVILTAILAVATSPILGVEIALTDEEKVKCVAEGGCGLVSYQWIKSKLEQEFERGKKACNSSV